jgi:acyl CoA:acetate/3-ketoacid CoA transferase alpha subunit/acyl CoA:acetate/3-ketoacid CoA transferase beta subunit
MPHSLLTPFVHRKPDAASRKLMSAAEAVRLVTAGSCVHLAATHSIPFGLAFELTRQFWGRRPGFELVTLGASVNAQVMLRDPGFLRRIVTSYAGNVYPAPGPAAVFQENYRTGAVPIENWSLCTLVQRLLAGALAVPFLPTRSLERSGLAEENAEGTLAHVRNPFGEGEQLVLRALTPDYTLVHGWAADSAGNVLARPPRTEGNYGALAARRGIIASVDRIVSPPYINAHSDDLLVPGSRVLALVKLPYGAHPSPCRGIAPHLGYAEDDQFLLDFRTASKDLTRLDAWIQQWVLTVNHDQYVARLGTSRLRGLTKRAAPDAWLRETRRRMREINFGAPPNPTEQMVVAMAQICAEQIRARGYHTILAGQGTSNLAAWLAYYLLAKEGCDVDLMAEIGLYGYAPRPPQPLIFNFANIATCKGVCSALDVLGIHVTGAQRESCIGLLGAGLIDEYGNVDSTCIPDLKVWLLGSGGANDVLSGAAEVIVCCPQDIRRLWRQVPYVTGPGDRVTTLVTTKGVFRRADPAEPFRLEAVLPSVDAPSQSLDAIVQEIRQSTGWDVHTAPTITRVALPEQEVLRLLRLFDPDRYYLA